MNNKFMINDDEEGGKEKLKSRQEQKNVQYQRL